MIQIIEVIRKEQLNNQPDGTVTVTYPADTTTVLSVGPNGIIDTRPQGTAGEWEKFSVTSKGLVIKHPKTSFLVPYAD